jgi:hypothetical protein
MKKIHYFHFGLERTATTWIHENFLKHPEVDYDLGKENLFLKFKKDVLLANKVFEPEKYLENYKDHYKDFNVSFCNNPEDWKLDEETIILLNDVTTHFGISFRNPFDMIKSLYNLRTIHMSASNYPIWLQQNKNWLQTHLDQGYLDYVSILDKIKSLIKKPLKIMFYDDIVLDQCKYFHDLQDFIGLTKYDEFVSRKINNRDIYRWKLEFNDTQIKQINNSIDNFSEYYQQDFSHWKV